MDKLVDQWKGDPWGTHVSVLRSLGQGVQRVLELGSGLYSTATFLDRDYYPDLTNLESFEHDPAWGGKVLAAVGSDPRHHLTILDEPIEAYLPPLRNFDLILVDNSDKAESRVRTILYVAGQNLGQAKVVLHDLEREDYRKAAEGFAHLMIYKGQTPWTGLASGPEARS